MTLDDISQLKSLLARFKEEARIHLASRGDDWMRMSMDIAMINDRLSHLAGRIALGEK